MSVATEIDVAKEPVLQLVDDRPGPLQLPPLVLTAAAEAAGVEENTLKLAVQLVLAGGPDALAPGWKYDALCRGESPDTFFPRHGTREAKALVDRCRNCPVQAACLGAALSGGERDGVWGGTSANGRRKLRHVLRDAGVMGVVGEQAYLSWLEPGADREPIEPQENRFASLEPWPHQLAAVDAVVEEISDGGRCQVALATASGKTHVGVWTAQRLGARRVLVLVPNLALISQTAELWAEASSETPAMLAVCSDTGELDLEATTDPLRVLEFVEETPGPLVVLATYQSSNVVADAGVGFDLTIADEAHHLAGEVDKHYAAIVRGEISTERILYMTATPRQFRRRKVDVDLVGMEDEKAFGRRVFEFPLSDAVEAGVVADYRVIVAAVERDVFERVAHRLEDSEVDPHLLAGAIAVVRAMGELGLTSCLSFHTRVDRARSFSALVGKVAEVLVDVRPPAPGWAGFVHGGASVRIRRRLLSRLGDERTWGVVANARALGEGVDLPTLDAVAIVDPKNAEADVIQACGRALRRPGKGRKDVGTVLLPVLLNDHADPEDPLAGIDERSAQIVAGVLRALRSHDTELSSRLDVTRRQLGRRGATRPDVWALLRKKAARGLLRSRVELWVPGGATGEIAGALALQVVRESTESWEESYGRLLAYVEEHGHARPVQSDPIPAAAGIAWTLGSWCSRQRSLRSRGLLSEERTELLAALPGWSWNLRDDAWWESFDALADYVKVHGSLPKMNGNGQMTWKGKRVAQFVNVVREAYKEGPATNNNWLRQFPDRIAALQALPGWSWNQRDADWETHFAQLERWIAAGGDASPGRGSMVDGFDMGKWVVKQRGAIRDGRRTAEQAARLRALPGWVDHTREASWDYGYRRCKAWMLRNANIVPPQTLVEDDGFGLGCWVQKQREQYRWGKIIEHRRKLLEELPGWAWELGHGPRMRDSRQRRQWSVTWMHSYEQLKAWAAEHGHAAPAQTLVLEGERRPFRIGVWVAKQRIAYRAGRLAPERVELLEALPGWRWGGRS